MNKISRSEAKNLGLKHYFTGKECKRGHIDNRNVSDKSCVSCKRERKRALRSIPEYRERERARERLAWKTNENRRKRKAYTDKKRRSSEEYKYSQRKKEKERYKNDAEYRSRKINSACYYFQRNKNKIQTRRREWFYKKYRTDHMFKIKHNCRSFVWRACIAAKEGKTESTFESLGYTAKEFKEHIERQFTKGMSWSNHGDWHIDHVVPVSHFIKIGETDPSVIHALHNLRPIWKEENIKKSDTLEYLV